MFAPKIIQKKQASFQISCTRVAHLPAGCKLNSCCKNSLLLRSKNLRIKIFASVELLVHVQYQELLFTRVSRNKIRFSKACTNLVITLLSNNENEYKGWFRARTVFLYCTVFFAPLYRRQFQDFIKLVTSAT